jgi:hypothetical protein
MEHRVGEQAVVGLTVAVANCQRAAHSNTDSPLKDRQPTQTPTANSTPVPLNTGVV